MIFQRKNMYFTFTNVFRGKITFDVDVFICKVKNFKK